RGDRARGELAALEVEGEQDAPADRVRERGEDRLVGVAVLCRLVHARGHLAIRLNVVQGNLALALIVRLVAGCGRGIRGSAPAPGWVAAAGHGRGAGGAPGSARAAGPGVRPPDGPGPGAVEVRVHALAAAGARGGAARGVGDVRGRGGGRGDGAG